MASKRKPINTQSAKLNYRRSTASEKPETKGTKPTTDPASIQEIMTLMVLHVCKKIAFFDIYRRVIVYLGALFLVSLIADVAPVPKTYLSRSTNIFNYYFVKYAWGWNLIILMPYVALSSYVYCCGKRENIIKHHVLRIIIATFFWWLWTNLFLWIESILGKCSVKGEVNNTKQSCLKNGFFWNGFDISGHSFILVYGSLFLIEETRSVVNWDSIKDYLRLEEHYRAIRDTTYSTNPLKSLSKEQLNILQISYEKFTPYIRGLFILTTSFVILWDIMLLGTMLYYHVMIEKLLGGFIAVVTWFVTYRIWYPSNYLPRLPGDGLFKYMKSKTTQLPPQPNRRRTGSIVNGSQPTFMGRPLYPNRNEDEVDETR